MLIKFANPKPELSSVISSINLNPSSLPFKKFGRSIDILISFDLTSLPLAGSTALAVNLTSFP